MGVKLCRRCGFTKRLDDYSFNKSGRAATFCKACMVERVREWRAANPERARANDEKARAKFLADPVRRRRKMDMDNARVRAKNPRKGRTFSVTCKRCAEVFSYVYSQKSREVCDLCRRYDNEWKTFGLTGKQAEDLRARGRCDICGGTRPGGRFNNWHIDHDHLTGLVRGVLCAHCNTAIGLLGDDPSRIRRAAAYLESHQSAATA